MTLFLNFLKLLLICALCSAIPFGYIGMIFGAPAYIIACIMIILIFRRQLG